ncbi:MAG: hypothetical protein WCQ53_05965, partial [bacterium]
MPKCENCAKHAKVLMPYGDMLLCKECVESYRSEESTGNTNGKWLIRTINGEILGPYEYEPLREMISTKKIVFLDEVSRSGDDWTLIKNIEFFKDIALNSNYNLNESTQNLDITKPPIEMERVERKEEAPTRRHGNTRPPNFKNKKGKRPDADDTDMMRNSILIQRSEQQLEEQAARAWWKTKRAALGLTALVLALVWVSSIYFLRYHNKNTNMFMNAKESDVFDKYYVEGWEYEEAGLFSQAQDAYDKALSLKSSHTGSRIRKAAIDLVIGGQINSAQRDLEKLYSEANIGKLNDQDEQADIKAFLGILEMKKGNNQSAIGYFN